MPDDPDNEVGMEVIKDSMGLTDEDLAPSTELDWGDEEDVSEAPSNEFEEEGPPQRAERQSEDPRQQQAPQGREAPQDPLRQNTLKFDPRTYVSPRQEGKSC